MYINSFYSVAIRDIVCGRMANGLGNDGFHLKQNLFVMQTIEIWMKSNIRLLRSLQHLSVMNIYLASLIVHVCIDTTFSN